ncbi:MAG: hypothetical protein A4S12_13065 [Proteobacteria bacterium SG_bin5]|nr:DUF58 domain-containing protein [Sphingomonas sp.]OQW45104.1 MAG: hypothetical protein A4S12_13065 [Proteobacteria bacterium SG_bin5]
MIYPSRLAIWAASLGAPAALLLSVVAPARWSLALLWPLAVGLLVLIDALLGAARATLALDWPECLPVGVARDAWVTLKLRGGLAPAAEIALGLRGVAEFPEDNRVRVPLEAGAVRVAIPVVPRRRGLLVAARVWARWRGPLGLVWHQRVLRAEAKARVLPDLEGVRLQAAQIFQRHALLGLIAQIDRGDGSEFDTLVDFHPGMDRRRIDWKHSARHVKLHAKEYRAERNSQILFLIDAGRQMSEPVAGLPRIDRAVQASLLTAWVALKLGDRVAIEAFDAAPRLTSGFVAGPGAFAELQLVAAEIDYSGAESNYTFALTTLAKRLTRRSIIVLFTEFTDLAAADFLVRAVARLVEAHLLMVVVLRDEELETIATSAPDTADDVTRAVTAGGLLRDRELVITRLKHLGVQVIESEHDRVGERLVAAYADLKRRGRL